MAENTRTVLIWFNNDEERLVFPVNPKNMAISRPRNTREFVTVDGESVHISRGRGLMRATLSTFLPGERSPFYSGVTPVAALAMLKRWQDTDRPVRLIISDTDLNDAFIITDLTQSVSEGDEDIYVSISLREYKFVTLEKGVYEEKPEIVLAARGDERPAARTHTVLKGETLWGIAVKYYGDGTRWREIASKNGVSDPKMLPVGKVLTL